MYDIDVSNPLLSKSISKSHRYNQPQSQQQQSDSTSTIADIYSYQNRQCEALLPLHSFFRTDKVLLRVYSSGEENSNDGNPVGSLSLGSSSSDKIVDNSMSTPHRTFRPLPLKTPAYSNGHNNDSDNIGEMPSGYSSGFVKYHHYDENELTSISNQTKHTSPEGLASLNLVSSIRASLGSSPRQSLGIPSSIYLESKCGHDISNGNENMCDEEFVSLGKYLIFYFVSLCDVVSL